MSSFCTGSCKPVVKVIIEDDENGLSGRILN